MDTKYIIGTISGVSRKIVEMIRENGTTITRTSLHKFKNFDYAIIEGDCLESTDVKFILTNNKIYEYYGMKKQHTGFDSENLELISDYYGGGCGTYGSIYEGVFASEAVILIKGMMKTTLEKNGNTVSEGLLILVKFIDEEE